MTKILFLLVILSLWGLVWFSKNEASFFVHAKTTVSGGSFPDFIQPLKLEDKWTDNSEYPDIIEFKADSLNIAWDKCQAEMPTIDKTVIGGGVEPACLQYEMGKFSCICILKLHKKNEKPFKNYVFYLKKQGK